MSDSGTLAQLAFVAGAALLTALATGLGALPLIWLRGAGAATVARASGVAAGLMLAATQLLTVDGAEASAAKTALGAAAGIAMIALISRFIHADHARMAGALQSAGARATLLIMVVMTAHSAAEGIGVGVSFGGGEELGVLVAIAIAVHNIPEGLAISLTMLPQGASVRRAAGWSIVSSLPQPLLAVPAFLFVEHFEGLLPLGLGFAAGAMAWMACIELIPEAIRGAGWRSVLVAVAAGYAAMVALTVALSA